MLQEGRRGRRKYLVAELQETTQRGTLGGNKRTPPLIHNPIIKIFLSLCGGQVKQPLKIY